jgi:carbamoyltransferase
VRVGPTTPRFGQLGYRSSYPLVRAWAAGHGFYAPSDPHAREAAEAFRAKLKGGEPVFLLGIAPGGHDAGVSLVQIARGGRVRLLASHEEERFVGVKHYAGYPERSVELVARQLRDLGLRAENIHACLASFDYVQMFPRGIETVLESFPASLGLLHPSVYPGQLGNLQKAFRAPRLLARQLGRKSPFPIIGMPHHGNHAYFAWAASPFARLDDPVLVTVIDATGEDSAISCYLVQRGSLRHVYSNRSFWDSLGHLFAFLSSSYGGWALGRAEGRWMSAAGYGSQERAENRYYRSLREILQLRPGGELRINRSLANWPHAGFRKPFAQAIEARFGRPIPYRRISDPAVCLSFDDEEEGSAIPDGAERAAATQLVFEDGLFHVVDHWIRASGCQHLIVTGGTALNCLANMRLLEHFDEEYFERVGGAPGKRLRLWVPPVPADEGAHAGAAHQFALRNGAVPGEPIRHAFYGGIEATPGAIEAALGAAPDLRYEALMNVDEGVPSIADLLASIVARRGIVGIHRGLAEIGRRALGHRSIVANPCDPAAREILNRDIKRREPFCPLAPMCTRREANRWFHLEPGADADDYSAYRWMAIAARARPGTRQKLPAIVHRDGTCRIQIVPEEDDLTHRFLEALGRFIGAEVAVNTSFNVGGPMVQEPQDALEILREARGLHAVLFVADKGAAYLASRRDASVRGISLQGLVASWRSRVESV